MNVKNFVIVGGGIAGLSAIKAIREENKSASVLWVNNEDRIPYKRTKINKHIAKGFSKDEFALIDHHWLADQHVELLYDKVEQINTTKHVLTFNHSGSIKYNKLIIATGKIPKHFYVDGLTENIVHQVHTARQVENIVRSTAKSKRYLVIGAGVEGVETAEQLIKLGKEVTLIERNSMVLKRFLTPKFAHMLEKSILNAGINLRLGITQLAYKQSKSGTSLMTIDGQEHQVDTIISTIGYLPNTKLAIDAHIKCNTGIMVNEHLETSAPDVYAAGDVAEHPLGQITGLWHAAEHQGRLAGLNACGKQLKLQLKPFRMKTDVFGEFYFSVLPPNNKLSLIEEEMGDSRRDMYFNNDKIEALLMKNDKSRAKIYQQALMEKWSLEKIRKEIPL
ncbi:nitrite reductase (NADH) large subunit [Saccharicrinis carchari]|uniref:Nitrite reductase (NADH) large subunit n=1 Tax=Saccharicrinis carchari TaxID=1168039 RepID=A0A521CZX6_SACCC|nr:FAD/NAD(P)-binding oxidoreductase [Saccharicrinis carchari]SMO65005.1 nitrite reductase (NADH) large subunit [Saccharicrinis carchari]